MAEHHPFPGDHAATGSSHYYAIRFAERHLHPALATVNAMVGSLSAIPAECSDPTVARHKLQWWCEELERVERGQANHPVATAFTGLLADHPVSVAPLMTMLTAVERQITGQPLADTAALKAHCRQLGSARAILFTQLCGGETQALASAQVLGEFVAFAGLLRDLGRDLRLQRCLLPLDPAPLLACIDQPGPPPERLRGTLAELSQAGRAAYRETLAKLPSGSHGLGPMLRLAALADALLTEIDREGYRVIERRTSLTPLHKLWIAWRRRG